MKSLVCALRITKNSFLTVTLLLSSYTMAMETTKNSMATIAKITEGIKATTNNINAKTLREIADEYYAKNVTLLVSDKSLRNTITQVQEAKPGEVEANLEELLRTVKNGAKLLYELANGKAENALELAKNAKHPDIVDIIKYLCLSSCNIRPDATCFLEGIVTLKPGTKYCENLRTFLRAYHERIKKENITGNSSINPLIDKAKSPNAFRLMCITITKTNQELLVRFLDKFEDFHITVPEDTKKGIRIKPERHPKTSLFNIIVVKAKATPDAGPEYNKETDVPQKLVEIFTKTFPNAKLEKNKISKKFEISTMYNHILKELAKATDERKNEMAICLTTFEKFAIRQNFWHLLDGNRIGSEIILGEEELCESYFATIEDKLISDLTDDDACGIFLKFKALQKDVHDYINGANAVGENALRAEIDNFFILANEKAFDSIKDADLKTHIFNSATTLKYLATLKEETLPNIPAKSLKERLTNPVFEKSYQNKLDLKGFIENIKLNKQLEKSKELAADTDTILYEMVNKSISQKYENDLLKKYTSELGPTTKLASIIKNNEDIQKTLKDPFFKSIRTTANLTKFPKTKNCLETFVHYLVGTAIQVDTENQYETKQKFITLLALIKTSLEKTNGNMMEEAEKKGYVCSASAKGKDVINKIKRPDWLAGEKLPDAIKHLKKIPQFFASEEALVNHVNLIFDKNNALPK